MNAFFKVIGWVVGVPLIVVIIFVVLGFMAIQFNFWPPDCKVLPILEARRVCEFSKLDKAPSGKPAQILFWVTVPSNTPATDKIFLAIKGKEAIEMERINDTTFEKNISSTTGNNLEYQYLRNNNAGSASDKKQLKIKSFNKNIYDFVSSWSDLPVVASIDKKVVAGVDMKDTWTINYNMNLFEDTRKDIDSSMDRAVAMGDKEFAVYSFIDMAGGKNDFTVKETTSPYYHWRDAAITLGEMKTLEKKAKAHGLSIVLRYNVGADYNQYYNVNPLGRFAGGQAGSGLGGNAAEVRAAKDFGRDEPKTKAWLDRYFTQLEEVLIKWGKDAQTAGIGAIDITPQYRPPMATPENAYADARFSQIIKNLRNVYQGKIYGSNFSKFGGVANYSDPLPKFINDLDRLYVYVAPIVVRKNASISEMKQAHADFLNQLETTFSNYQKPVFLVMDASSYDGATSGKPGMEWGDWAEVQANGYKENWQEQADSYEGFFRALAGRTFFAGVSTGFYWWDDFMAPKYMGTANDMEGTIRGKPAEAVWKKWMFGR